MPEKERVLSDKRPKLKRKLGMTTERQLRLHPPLDPRQPQLLQARGLEQRQRAGRRAPRAAGRATATAPSRSIPLARTPNQIGDGPGRVLG